MAAPRRYYPGFLGAFFLILLRTAIGWHFFYEGVYKINSTPSQRDSWAGWVLTRILPPPHDFDKEKDPPFSAEGYLRASTGPAATYFRALIPDVNSLAKLDRDDQAGGVPTRLKAAWRNEMERISDHFSFDDQQKKKADDVLANANAEIDAWFLNVDNAQAIKKYYRDLRHVLNIEESPESMPYQRTNAYKLRREVEKDRKKLVADIDAIHAPYHEAWLGLATKAQADAKGGLISPWNSLDWINFSTMWGLVLVGGCLMLGLFTPLAALGGCAYLVMFYLSMPPWPGLPLGPASEGHYLYVNKNLIELIACLVLASTPSGMWIGLDAWIFGRFGRDRRRAPALPASASPAPPTVAVAVPSGGSFKKKRN